MAQMGISLLDCLRSYASFFFFKADSRGTRLSLVFGYLFSEYCAGALALFAHQADGKILNMAP